MSEVPTALLHGYFNSTMVRLKGSQTQVSDVGTPFQFHYGTIKRYIEIFFLILISVISIPLWYD